MTLFLGLLGFVVIVITMVDIVWTTLVASSGGGPLSGRVASWLWRSALTFHHPSSSHRFLATAGVAIVLIIFVLWSVLILGGWVLIFNAGREGIVETQTSHAAGWWSRLYFTGFTLITLGVGDYRPNGALWQVATVVAGANGFFLVTLAITYLGSMVSAEVETRQLAAHISSLGGSASEIVIEAWDGKAFSTLTQHLISLTPMVALNGQYYLAYPILHQFHSLSRATAITPSIVALDEALTVLEHGLAPEHQPDRVALRAVRRALSELLPAFSSAYIKEAEHDPPVPSLKALRKVGIVTVSDEAFASAIKPLASRRRLLLALVQHSGWSWDAVLSGEGSKG